MRISLTFTFYMLQQLALGVVTVLGGLSFLVFLLDFVELLRRASGKNIAFFELLMMALMKLPFMVQMILPFAILFGAMLAFWRLTRSQELVIARAVGISAWKFLLGPIIFAVLLGLLKMMVLSPLAAAMQQRYETLELRYFRGQISQLSISDHGLWLRQESEDGYDLVHAPRYVEVEQKLLDPIILRFDEEDHYLGRLDAAESWLQNGFWQMEGVWQTLPDQPAEFFESRRIRTNLTPAKIQESFADPETISFWELPSFIQTLKQAGFSALKHQLYFQQFLASPLLFCAMVLIAAIFSLRIPRRGHVFKMMMGGVLTGFLLYFLSDLISAYGLSARIPILLAAWAPALVACLIGMTSLLHLEDG